MFWAWYLLTGMTYKIYAIPHTALRLLTSQVTCALTSMQTPVQWRKLVHVCWLWAC